MPFTPFHMGPGLMVKALARRKFSLMVFGWSQIVIDLQPLYVLLTGRGELHGFSHTLVGAALLGLLCGVSGKYLGEWGLRLLRLPRHLPIAWGVSLTSAFVGTFSHVAIDSVMHADVVLFGPWSAWRPLYGIISLEALHAGCLGLAVVGGLGCYALARRQGKSV